MKEILMSKPALMLASTLATAAALADGESGSGTTVSSQLLESYITTGQSEVVKLLTAGAAIVGAFFVWSLLKKAINRSK